MSGELIQLETLGGLLLLDLSYNNFTGNIPRMFISPAANLSYNSLKGSIPDNYDQVQKCYTLIGNKDLCGDYIGLPPCLPIPASNKSIITDVKFFVPIPISLGFLVLLGFLLSRRSVKKTQFESQQTKNGNLFSVWNYDGYIAYEDIIEATENFDKKILYWNW